MHRHPQLAVEAEDLPQVPLQVLDVVADAAHAELAEVGEVLADLRGVEVELLGQRLRRDRLDAGGFELVQAAEVDRQPVGGELGDLFGGGLPLVRQNSQANQNRPNRRQGKALSGSEACVTIPRMAQTASPPRPAPDTARISALRPRATSRSAEFTAKAIVLGVLFGLIFGASTVYLGLRAGLTCQRLDSRSRCSPSRC